MSLGSLEMSWAVLAWLGRVLGRNSGHFGVPDTSWRRLGSILERLGRILGEFGRVLEASREVFGSIFGRFSAILGNMRK